MTAPRYAASFDQEQVAPSLTDPLARDVSESWGGVQGSHLRNSPRWLNPLVVVLMVATGTFAIGIVEKAPCVATNWSTVAVPFTFTHMCYSDIQYLYTGRDFAHGTLPYEPLDRTEIENELAASNNLAGIEFNAGQVNDRVTQEIHNRTVEYPVLTGAYMGMMSALTHVFGTNADLSKVPYADLGGNKDAQHDSAVFWNLNAIGFFVALLIALTLLVKAQRRRPWDALFVAASPVLALDALVNWDLLAIAFVAAIIWAWATRRPVWAGVFIGLGTATKLYPLFFLGPLLVLCLRERRLDAWLKMVSAALVAWLIVDLPVFYWSPTGWLWFWQFNKERDGQYGSVWYLFALYHHPVSVTTINAVTLVFFAICCVAIAALALRAPRRPRLVPLVFLVVASFLIVNKVYSPQYALWLLPLAALARPRWRDLLIWQACEALYFFAIWMQIASPNLRAGDGPPVDFTGWYTFATIVRIFGLVYLMGVVVRDVIQPWHDPVRSDGLTDDPLGGILDEGVDVEVDELDDEVGWRPTPTPQTAAS